MNILNKFGYQKYARHNFNKPLNILLNVKGAVHARVNALLTLTNKRSNKKMDPIMAWDHVQDTSIKAGMIKAAAGKAVAPGPEGKSLFQKVLDNTKPDFNSNDGTPATKYAGKGLDQGDGGRAKLLYDKLLAAGTSSDDAKAIVAKNAAAGVANTSAIAAKSQFASQPSNTPGNVQAKVMGK